MKLTCATCGHPNHVHFAGTAYCHQWSVEIVPVETSDGTFVDGRKEVRCRCRGFVLVAPKLERSDLA